MRLLWLTDLHLNCCSVETFDTLLDDVSSATPDALVVSGDISESKDVVQYLKRMDDRLQRPLYFVLGNHDFYFGSIAEVRLRMDELCAQRPNLRYLTNCDVIELTPGLGLVGHDGWADGRIGDYQRSRVMLNDYRLIRELAKYNKQQRWPVLNSLGDEAAEHVRRVLTQAVEKYPSVLLATHVPPLHEACWHEGRLSDDEWAPHFSCQAVGDAILEIMTRHPDRQLTVVCGHTHGAGECRPLPNVLILTGGAEYRKPTIQRAFVWD